MPRILWVVLGAALGTGQAAHACQPINVAPYISEVLDADAIVSARIRESTILEYQGTLRKVPVSRLLLLDLNRVLFGSVDDFTDADTRFDLYVTVPYYTGTYTPVTEGGGYIVAALYKEPAKLSAISVPIVNAIVPEQRDAYLSASPKYHVASRGCGFAWIHDSGGPVSKAIQQILDGNGDQDAEIAVLGEFLKLDGRVYQHGEPILDAEGQPLLNNNPPQH